MRRMSMLGRRRRYGRRPIRRRYRKYRRGTRGRRYGRRRSFKINGSRNQAIRSKSIVVGTATQQSATQQFFIQSRFSDIVNRPAWFDAFGEKKITYIKAIFRPTFDKPTQVSGTTATATGPVANVIVTPYGGYTTEIPGTYSQALSYPNTRTYSPYRTFVVKGRPTGNSGIILTPAGIVSTSPANNNTYVQKNALWMPNIGSLNDSALHYLACVTIPPAGSSVQFYQQWTVTIMTWYKMRRYVNSL